MGNTDPTGHLNGGVGPITLGGTAVGAAASGGAIFILGSVAVVAGAVVLLSFLFSGTAANDEMTPAQKRTNAINIAANDPYGRGRWPSYDQELKQLRNLRGGGGSGLLPLHVAAGVARFCRRIPVAEVRAAVPKAQAVGCRLPLLLLRKRSENASSESPTTQ